MPWELIQSLIGPGLHWDKPQELLEQAIARAEELGRDDAAEHLRIILRNRNIVMFDQK